MSSSPQQDTQPRSARILAQKAQALARVCSRAGRVILAASRVSNYVGKVMIDQSSIARVVAFVLTQILALCLGRICAARAPY